MYPYTYLHSYANVCRSMRAPLKRQITMEEKINTQALLSPTDWHMRAAVLFSEKTFYILRLAFGNLCDNVLNRYYPPLCFYRQGYKWWCWRIFICLGQQYGAHPLCCVFPKASFDSPLLGSAAEPGIKLMKLKGLLSSPFVRSLRICN